MVTFGSTQIFSSEDFHFRKLFKIDPCSYFLSVNARHLDGQVLQFVTVQVLVHVFERGDEHAKTDPELKSSKMTHTSAGRIRCSFRVSRAVILLKTVHTKLLFRMESFLSLGCSHIMRARHRHRFFRIGWNWSLTQTPGRARHISFKKKFFFWTFPMWTYRREWWNRRDTLVENEILWKISACFGRNWCCRGGSIGRSIALGMYSRCEKRKCKVWLVVDEIQLEEHRE